MAWTSRREFVVGAAAALPALALRLPVGRRPGSHIRLAVVTDLHHGLAPDALNRFDAFLGAVAQREGLDAVWQLGDFCYSDAGAADCLARWRAVPLPRFSVLGNHDMDKVDKPAAVTAFGMTARHYATVIGGWRFVVLDLNNFRKDGQVYAYANGNYFTDNATFNLADPEQLSWLDHELRTSREPVVLVSHQPMGFGSGSDPLPPEQREVLAVVESAALANPAGRVACCLSGHLHVDRLESVGALPCLSVNSASYFWSDGMYPYSKPLFAFMEFGSDGVLRVEGQHGEFVKTPPKESDGVAGRSASLSSRRVQLAARGAHPSPARAALRSSVGFT